MTEKCQADHAALWRLLGGCDFLLVRLRQYLDDELKAAEGRGEPGNLTRIFQQELRYGASILAQQVEDAQADLRGEQPLSPTTALARDPRATTREQ